VPRKKPDEPAEEKPARKPGTKARTGHRAKGAGDETAELMAGKEVAGTVAKPRAGQPRRVEDPNDPDKQPDRRARHRVQLGKRWSQILEEVKDGQYTWAEFAESLDPEELARGQLKDKNGGFGGRPPALVPRAFHDACMKELHRRFNEKMQGRLLGAVDDLISLSSNGKMDGKDQAKTLIYIIERVMGPVPKTVEVRQEQPWQMTVQGLLRPAVDGEPQPRATKDRYAKRRRAVDPSEDVDD